MSLLLLFCSTFFTCTHLIYTNTDTNTKTNTDTDPNNTDTNTNINKCTKYGVAKDTKEGVAICHWPMIQNTGWQMYGWQVYYPLT